MSVDPDDSLVLAVCTYRMDEVRRRWRHNASQLDHGDELIVVADCPWTPQVAAVADDIRRSGGEVLVHGATRGLSRARNTVLEARPDHRVLYIDDDVLISREALKAIRSAFSTGAHVVGARLVPPSDYRRRWFLAEGQVHLLGWHPSTGVTTWGACMGIDSSFAQKHDLEFDTRLGRVGSLLLSGEDSSFVAAMRAAGAQERFLDSVGVVHDISSSRLTLRYLLRRTYWQGRTETRRGNAIGGLRKEWRRYRRNGPAWLAIGYLAVLVAGMTHELIASDRTRPRRRAESSALLDREAS